MCLCCQVYVCPETSAHAHTKTPTHTHTHAQNTVRTPNLSAGWVCVYVSSVFTRLDRNSRTHFHSHSGRKNQSLQHTLETGHRHEQSLTQTIASYRSFVRNPNKQTHAHVHTHTTQERCVDAVSRFECTRALPFKVRRKLILRCDSNRNTSSATTV